MSPQRIQLRRTKGWRKPEGAIVVSRPSKWGNPFRVYLCDCCGSWDVIDDNSVTYLIDHLAARTIRPARQSRHEATRRAVDLFHQDGFEWLGGRFMNLDMDVAALAGHDLACWCPLDQPCHADVLLELANTDGSGTE